MKTSPTDGYRPYPQDRSPNGSGPGGPGEDTLRLIAGLPAPSGLADRVRAGLHAAPRGGWVLMGRGPLRPPGGWMYSSLVRGLAAAAIVCVVAGGAWRIYSHVQPAAKAVILPASPGGNGFSTAGSRRVPETLQGPVLVHPVPGTSEVNATEKVPAPSKDVPGAVSGKRKKAHLPVAAAPVQ